MALYEVIKFTNLVMHSKIHCFDWLLILAVPHAAVLMETDTLCIRVPHEMLGA
jgi:hypothetical protein